jgi:hypothetical protein
MLGVCGLISHNIDRENNGTICFWPNQQVSLTQTPSNSRYKFSLQNVRDTGHAGGVGNKMVWCGYFNDL